MNESARVVRLRDGNAIPPIGLGTHGLTPGSVSMALDNGYRLFDTAFSYGNEEQVGRELLASGVVRDQYQVVTKLPGRHHGFRETVGSLRASLRALGLDYVDLYLIHWPNPHVGRFVESWRAMIELREIGLVRSIGVSNFTPRHIETLIEQTGVVPSVNQVELHPHWHQEDLRRVHRELGIVTQGWSPLGDRAALLEEPAMASVLGRRLDSPAQLVLQWHRQLGVVPLPRSADPARQRENITEVRPLDGVEMAAMSSLGQKRLWGADPDLFRDE